MAITDKLTAIANAIRSKTGKSEGMTLVQMVTEINGISTGGSAVDPKFAAEMTDTVAKVNALTSGNNCYVMVFIADTHAKAGSTGLQVFTEATMHNVKELCERVHVDAVVHLGDLIDGSEPRTTSIQRIKDLRGLMMKCGTKWRIHDGNHDHNGFQGSETSTSATAEFISTADMANMLAMHVDTVNASNNLMYFYEDIDDLNMRVVYVSSNYMDNVGGGYGTAWGYPAAEVNWIRDTALDTTYKILFCSHMGLIGSDSQYGTQPKNGAELKQIIDDFCDRGGSVIGWINGHNHWDRIKEYDYFKAVSVNGNGVWNKSHTSDIPSSVTDAQRWDRSMSDYTMDCFDVAVINTDANTVNFVRFGAGDDRSYAFSDGVVPIRFTSVLNDITAKDGDFVPISLTTNKLPESVVWEGFYGGEWINLHETFGGFDTLNLTLMLGLDFNGIKLRCTVSDGVTSATTREATVTVTAVAPDVPYTNVLDTVGYTDGQYMSGNATGSDANYTATGYIPFTNMDILYIQGNPGWANESHCRMTTFNSSKTVLKQLHSYTSIQQYFTVDTLGTNYVMLTPKQSGSYVIDSSTAYVRMSLKGKGADLIITVNEPIS